MEEVTNVNKQTNETPSEPGSGESKDNRNEGFCFTDMSLESLRKLNEKFIKEREWDKFHSPRNVLLAMVGEVGELAEIFQWKGEVTQGLPELSEEEKVHVGEELSDILIYLIDFASRCHIDLPTSVVKKMEANAIKYPVEKAYGQANKCTDYK
ncbi:dCTP pyrophosphatase 1-like [Physella acuta]|uniref:dCTP pyrophosphatase 1-like n=1 Tax=Physella acuta TaxID=109671 RepID=UPI0027DE7D6E|nr:dCTP pyrophosphatase 1-like [Physella acuta]